MWAGSGFIAYGAMELWPEVGVVIKNIWLYCVYITVVVICTVGQSIMFYRNTLKLLRDYSHHETSLLPWHFLPPAPITFMILAIILGFEIWHQNSNGHYSVYASWLLVKLCLDMAICVALFVGGSVLVFSVLREKTDAHQLNGNDDSRYISMNSA